MTLTLSKFLEPFYPTDTESVWLFAFSPKNAPEKASVFRREVTRAELSSNRLLQNNLKHINKKQGVYFVVNAGGTEKTDINRINAVFCEKDDLSITEQHDLYDNAPLPPSIRVETLKSVHAYWLLNEPFTVHQFAAIQNGLIDSFSADNHIRNENRLMRLPFFNHVHWADGAFSYKRVNVHTFNTGVRFSFEELQEAFPVPEITTNFPAEAETLSDWDAVKTELRRRIFAHPTYRIESNREWGTCQGVCHNGRGKTAIAVNLASGFVHCQKGCDIKTLLAAFGLSLPIANKVRLKPRMEQNSGTYKWLREYVERR